MDLYQHISILLLFLILDLVLGEGVPCVDDNNQPITTCQRCLWKPECTWCPERISSSLPAIGCIKKGSYKCKEPEIRPQQTVRITEDRPLSQSASVQLAPQALTLTMSPNQEGKVNFNVALADVPVDIYFVMDLSNSMHIHKKNLVNAAEMIVERVMSLTRDYRIGFGSFSDKPTPPFSSEASYYKLYDKNRQQPPPYSFYHQLSLTRDTTLFREGVKAAPLAANVDSPESGLDALMQAITCDSNVIGWRDEVRKVIIFITDEDTHYAMDGKLGGLVRPQDNQCSTRRERHDRFMTYKNELKQDYPSFGQIRDQLTDKNMVVIFAVAEYMDAIYRELSRFIQGTENIGHLKRDPSSLQNIVVQQYQAIKSRIVIHTNSSDQDNIRLSFNSTCQESSVDFKTCSNVKEGEVINFEVSVSLKKEACRLKNARHIVRIGLAGFPKDALLLEVECEECACNGRPQFTSPVCNFDGSLVCGGCECNPGYSGKTCECKPSSGITDLAPDKCQQRSGGAICGGKGTCICGSCQCDAEFLGEFCHCEREFCPKGRIGSVGPLVDCSGEGVCKCDIFGKTSCECGPGFEGSDCSCPVGEQSDRLCRDDVTKQICFGRGTCSCGQCQCDPGYEGKYCQRNKDMTVCQKLEPCIKAHQFRPNGSDSDAAVAFWAAECQLTTTHSGIKLYGDNVEIGCTLVSDQGKADSLVYREGVVHNCGDTLRAYESERNSSITDHTLTKRQAISGRGDQLIDYDDDDGQLRVVSTKDMSRCVGFHDGCEFTFFHANVESDEYFNQKGSGNVFVVHHKVNETWQALGSCYGLPIALVVGSTVGILFVIGIGLLVATIVIINLNDLRRWQQYQAWKAENEQRLGEHRNPLYQAKTTTFQNPAFASGK